MDQRHRTPAWALSTAVHTVILVLLAMTIQLTPRGAAEEPNRQGGIVLVSRPEGRIEYQDPAAGDPAQSAADGSDARLPKLMAPSDLTSKRPELPGQGPAKAPSELGSATELTQGQRPQRNLGGGGKAQTSVFGVTGTGSRFVYVFDRSESMLGYQGRPLASAKYELKESLTDLGERHEFQIIFYNNRTTVLNPWHPQPPRMMSGSETNKTIARGFVSGIRATGGTRHMEALRLALAMGPDVIFFLTDAAEPVLSDADLSRLKRLNSSATSINTIEFGIGPFSGRGNFLVRLAKQNHGQHVYVDVARLPGVADDG